MTGKGKGIRRWFWASLLCLFFLLSLSSCKKEKKATVQPMGEKPIQTKYMEKNMTDLPYFGILNHRHFILPTAGSVTEVEVTSYRKAVMFFDENGLEFWVKGNWEEYLHQARLYRVKDGTLLWEQPYFNLNFQPTNLQERELYLLRIELSNAEDHVFYDFPFYYQANSSFSKVLEEVANDINSRRQEPEKTMGELALTIEEVGVDGEIQGTAKTVVAIRKEGGFEYLDKSYRFEVTADGQKTITETIRNKKRGTYDKIRKSVVLSGDGQWYENMGKFVQIEENEVYAGDARNVYTLYRRDEINEDYLIDETNSTRFRGIGWKNNKFYFMGYGLFGEEIPALSGYRGIAFFQWDGIRLHIPYFTEVKEAEIEEYMNKHLFLRSGDTRVFWLLQRSYYILNLDGHHLYKSEVPLRSQFESEEGIFYWQAQQDRRNQAVLWNNIMDENIHTLYFEDRNQKILGIGSGHIYVGEYQAVDSLEYLNREIVYPLRSVVMYDWDGNVKKSMMAPTGKYFGLPVFIEKDFGILPILEKKYVGKTHRGEVKVEYHEIGEQNFDFRQKQSGKESDKPSMMQELLGTEQDFYGTNLRLTSGVPKKLSYGENKTALLEWEEKVESGNYFVRAGQNLILAENLQKALISAKGLSEYQIYYVRGLTEELLYDSKWKKSEIMIPRFSVVKQFPELPRGCEVTALSMLLQHYDPQLPDRFALANELTEYSRQVGVGKAVNQIDMKEAFAGSMFNSKEAGLGVYIEPISLIARRYLGSRVQNVTGISLNQLLTFVSNGQPVQVISSDMADAVPESLRTTWETTNGYMEITYREHSVVVVGFDTTAVYFADPLTGRVEKSPRKNFEAGFEAFGRQALVIMD